jgi:hypothetical protein
MIRHIVKPLTMAVAVVARKDAVADLANAMVSVISPKKRMAVPSAMPCPHGPPLRRRW